MFWNYVEIPSDKDFNILYDLYFDVRTGMYSDILSKCIVTFYIILQYIQSDISSEVTT